MDVDRVLRDLAEASLLKSAATKTTAIFAMGSALRLLRLLNERVDQGTITSEEGAVMNALIRNIQKLHERLGVEELMDPDEDEL